jgi:succinate dehydrogenase/fumarate reductase flavoprotein subunit
MAAIETDIIVVGGGGAGLAAAIEAATLGCSVTVIEKNPAPGGSTIMSVGSIAATGTDHQRRQGIVDSSQDHFEDLGVLNECEMQARWMGYHNVDNLDLRRILVENAGETLAWLESMGIRFFGPVLEPPHRKPRMHNVLPNSRAYGYWLLRHARRLGIPIHTEHRVCSLVRDGDRVVGVEAEANNGSRQQFLARAGVILTCGDWSSGSEMKRRYARAELADMSSSCNPANTGDLHEPVIELGAKILNSHMAVARVRFVPPPLDGFVHKLPPWRALTWFMQWAMNHLPAVILRPFIMSFLTTVLEAQASLYRDGAILVNTLGERFCNELEEPEFAIAKQPRQHAYIVFDSRVAQMYSAFPHFISTAPGIAYAYVPDYRRSRPDLFHSATTIEELALSFGADPEKLRTTVAQTKLGDKAPIDRAPFFALGPVSCYVRGTEGGLAIDTEFRIIDGDGIPIDGLYGAGLFGQGGVMLEGHGQHLSWAFTSGRLAGRSAAKQAGR